MATQFVVATEPAPPVPSSLVVAEQVVHIPLPDVQLSKTNPRTSIDAEQLSELAADIQQRGVQEPILVRPVPSEAGKFEVVFGERRYRASQLAGKDHIPAIVRSLSDDETYEIQVNENLQRADLHPLDEAQSFEVLYNKAFASTQSHDASIAIVASKVSKKPAFVLHRLKLLDLIPAAKEAFRKGQIELGHALELCRLRAEEQESALEWLLKNYREVPTMSGRKKVAVLPGVPDLKLWIQQTFFLNLKKAPFDTKDAELYAEMGSCQSCRFRTGNQPGLFPDVKTGATCTVPECWATKRNNTLINIANGAAKELGVPSVLKVGIGYQTWNRDHIPVDVYIEYNSESRIVDQANPCRDTKPGVVTWIEIDRPSNRGALKVGDTVHVCTQAKTCATHNNVDSRPRKTFEEMAGTRIDNLRVGTHQRIRAALIRAVIEKAMKDGRISGTFDRTLFGLFAEQMHSDLFFDHHRVLCKLFGVEPVLDERQSKDWRRSSKKIFGDNSIALMVAMSLMHQYHLSETAEEPLAVLLRLYKIDVKAIETKIKTEIDEKIEQVQEQLKNRKTKARKAAKAEPQTARAGRQGSSEKRRAKTHPTKSKTKARMKKR